MTWLNSDGLFVKFGKEEATSGRGGQSIREEQYEAEFTIDYTDINLSTQILGSGSGATAGSLGVMVPKGVRIEELETIVETAFTSSGTIGTSTFVLGLIRVDRSTELDYDGFLTTAYTGGNLDAAGEKVVVRVGSTGAGALIGTTLSNNGMITVSNSQHASHPYTAGRVRVRIRGFVP